MTEEQKQALLEEYEKECKTYAECGLCPYDYTAENSCRPHCELVWAYEKGRMDIAEDLLDIFDYDLFLEYSNDDRFISFNNLSLMISDVVYELKEKK